MKDEKLILCPICGDAVKKQGIGTHKRKAHGITKQSQKNFLEQLFNSLGDLGNLWPEGTKKKK